jgi:hypothetical protein
MKAGKKQRNTKAKLPALSLHEFVAPRPTDTEPYVQHEPFTEVSAGKPYSIEATIVGIDTGAQVTLLINNLAGVYKTIPMVKQRPYAYKAEVPADVATPGLVRYRIMVQKGKDEYYTFPGGHKGYPYAWDYYQNESWQTYVSSPEAVLQVFNASQDQQVFIYPNLWRPEEKQLFSAKKPDQLILRLASKELSGEHIMGWQHYITGKLKGRSDELSSFTKIVIRARTTNTQPLQLKVNLISADAQAYATYVQVNKDFADISIPFDRLKPDSFILLPRPYPGFQPFKFETANKSPFRLEAIEKLEITLGENLPPAEYAKPYSLEVESVWLEK